MKRDKSKIAVMCDTIDSSNLGDLEAKFESITSHRTFNDSQNVYHLLKDRFLDLLDSVILANLSGLDLSVIPQLVFFALNIEALDLSHNCFRELNGNLESWRKLRHINLSHNQFEIFPWILIKLLALRSLCISCNYLELIPSDWSALYNLEELDLSSNRIVDISPLINIQSLKILNLSGNMISILPYDIHKLKNLLILNCQRNQIYQLPNSLVQMKLLQELDVLENPLVFPPFNIVSRGLAHILAFLSRNEQKALLHPPLLKQQQNEDDEDLAEEVEGEMSTPSTLLSSPSASRPSSAMATFTWQQSYLPTTSDRTESSQSESCILRRRSSQPEFYKLIDTTLKDTDYSSVSLTSLSDNETSVLELRQPCRSQQLWKEEQCGKAYSSYPTISPKLEEMDLERHRPFTGSPGRPQPPPRSAFPPSIAGRSKLYVRQRTPSPPPRRPRLLASLPRLPAARLSTTRPLLHSQRSYPPAMHSPPYPLPDGPSKMKLNTPNVELTRLPQQVSNASAETSEDSVDDFSTDSSYEDLPVPRLRNRLPLSGTPSPFPQHHLTGRPGQSTAQTTASLQQHRYLKHGQANPNLLPYRQRPSQLGGQTYRSGHPNEAFSLPQPVMSLSHEIPRSPQPLYSQAHQYDELWRSTAEALRMILVSHLNTNLPSTPVELASELKTGIHLAEFLNNYLGYKAVKKIYEVAGSSWRIRARQNLLSSREAIHSVGVPKHRLFSVTRVLAADTTVGLFGLLHCLQTLLEVWASRSSTFMMGGLGVREKLSNKPTPYRSLLGDITTNRHMHHQLQQRHRTRTFSNPNYGASVSGSGGVFSDV